MPGVVFGNSSTAAPLNNGGSNVRQYYSAPRGLPFLYQQYRANNLYIYPEHRDHDPEHGDVFPANSPYLITSQGSSSSDQPFMRAIPYTLAAFRPEVKKKLVDEGLLMPTLQLILRSTYTLLKHPSDYLTGRAHPSVFEGKGVDPIAMIDFAHAITLETLPPMIQLAVEEEDHTIPGVDFFDATPNEKLADTPCAIARVFRGREQTHRMVISAEKSFDPRADPQPLRFEWVVLRGDRTLVKIRPLNTNASRVEITVPYQARRAISAENPMASNRIDIGAFVHNGAHYSAPGFITCFSLANETRAYDAEGKLIERAFGVGNATLKVNDWPKFISVLSTNVAAQTVIGLEAEKIAAIQQRLPDYETLTQAIETAKTKSSELNIQRSHLEKTKPGSKQHLAANKTAGAARIAFQAAQQEREDWLDEKRGALGQQSVRSYLFSAIHRAITHPDFCSTHAALIDEHHDAATAATKAVIHRARNRLVEYGVVAEGTGAIPDIQLRAPLANAIERKLLRHFNATVLNQLFLDRLINVTITHDYVDPRISRPKFWRDVYHYDADGQCTGWTRHIAGGAQSYTGDGKLITEFNEDGSVKHTRRVQYRLDPKRKGAIMPVALPATHLGI